MLRTKWKYRSKTLLLKITSFQVKVLQKKFITLLHAHFSKIVLKYSNEVHLLRYLTPLAERTLLKFLCSYLTCAFFVRLNARGHAMKVELHSTFLACPGDWFFGTWFKLVAPPARAKRLQWKMALKGPYRPDAIWQRDSNFQFSMTFNFTIFLCFSNVWNHLSNFSYLVCISCKIFIRWRFWKFALRCRIAFGLCGPLLGSIPNFPSSS
jgi:hypothetical protein